MVYDVWIETSHQSLCTRLVTYFDQRSTLTLFPESNFGTRAEELGPHTSTSGPKLVRLSGVTASPEQLHACSREELLAVLAAQPAPAGGVRLQCLPLGLNSMLLAALPRSWRLHPVHFDTVLHVLECEGKLNWGLAPAASLWRTPPDLRVARGCSRAVHKLQEALRALRGGACSRAPLRLGTVVDVGAAPGGWTAHLATMAERVIAIDPAALAPEVAALPNVTHLHARSEDALADILRLAPQGADLLVCDMNLVPPEVMPLVAALLPALRPGAQVIVTLKFVGVGRDRATAAKTLR
ncbi:hypothetical protein WJX81_006499 [Elliptochloris bilobata]|uniref:Ribosomal RNA methyltransferase FtsJ domain-containing protein n=1 Tax=Elliptochloris bilobata TaxID=381761 RepID=A0AAW1SKZ2_9CHLO